MKEAAKFTKCETFTSIYKVGMISSGLCILYIYEKTIYVRWGIYQKLWIILPFFGWWNFPLKMIWNNRNSVINYITNRYNYNYKKRAAPAQRSVPKLNELNPARKVPTGPPKPKNEAGNRKPLGRGKKMVSLAGGNKQMSNSSNSSKKMEFLSWLMFFFCFSKGVVGYDSQPRSGVNVQLVLGKGRCIYAKSVESREPFWSLHPQGHLRL